MTEFNIDYGNKTGMRNNTGIKKIIGVEFNSGYGYVSGKRNKAG
jgi:hypothetical protein